ncbi:transketolase [Candidatus Woesearchaeota archaeon]|nr:MAG: transketolase [archaeon GW2011_AR18]MBS3161310.1 transketolase [Candidatus Woesearchaeota archaeon]HIH26265.1 transketolase [Nanoarchaeota archaeon]
MVNTQALKDIATILRRDVLKMTTTATSGHPTTCLSSAEILSVLFFSEMSYDTKNALNPDNDELILSKGHAAPILYSVLARSGCIDYNLNTLRSYGSPLEGHPLPTQLKWIKVATGSLGQGLGVGVGIAIASKMQKRKCRTYVLLGDSECAEGSVYEALEIASHYKLNNLCAIIDVNRLGQRGETLLGHDTQAYKKRFEGFGWNAVVIDGHNIEQIQKSLGNARKDRRPTVIIAKTLKGKGVSFLEDKEGWHGKALTEHELEKALKELKNPEMPNFKIKTPKKIRYKIKMNDNYTNPEYKLNDNIATREAYGKALVKLAKNNSLIVATDAEVGNSTHAEDLKKAYPNRFVEAYIAEQNMISMALGMSVKGYNVFASSFACFLSRAHDQIRMASISNANLTIVGSHAGSSIGEDGPSQMGLEDIAIFRALPRSIVLYPSDAVSTEKLTLLASNISGIKYIRTTRPKTPVLYNNREVFELGEFKILKQSKNDKAVIVGAGITVHEAIKAAERLSQDDVETVIVDCYCIKPFNTKRFIELVKKSGNKVVIVEDHYKEGGIGEMIMAASAGNNIEFEHLCVREMPHSGTKEKLMEIEGINDKSIIRAVKRILKLNYSMITN